MSFELSYGEAGFLVKLARKAISTYLDKGVRMPVPRETPKKILQKRGVFVTLSVVRGSEKRLRGCIGYPEPRLPLAEATISSAINAATGDPRFPPLSKSELGKVVVEVSVLTPPELISVEDPRNYLKLIVIGRDGLIVERGVFKGLLLPQVPVEWGWDVEEFLSNCCMKAGLYPDAWLLDGTRVYSFSCIIAREASPGGMVEVVDMRKGRGH